MKCKKRFFYCNENWLSNIPAVSEIDTCIERIKWEKQFQFPTSLKVVNHQSGYNKALENEFIKYGWRSQPIICANPKLAGDFAKDDIFIKIQFGNSANIFRDYYKFYYGVINNLQALNVLIVTANPKDFFPTRPNSVQNMADFDFADRYFKLLPIPVPILLIGLLPEN